MSRKIATARTGQDRSSLYDEITDKIIAELEAAACPPELREHLLANGRERDAYHVPMVKFFNPLGAGVWLATELDEDGDTLFRLADLGEPELGSFGLAEMAAVRLRLGLGIERDILFEGCF